LGSIGGQQVRQTKRRLAFVGPFLCFVSLGKQRNEGKNEIFSTYVVKKLLASLKKQTPKFFNFVV
jgi:hypothetical protein